MITGEHDEDDLYDIPEPEVAGRHVAGCLVILLMSSAVAGLAVIGVVQVTRKLLGA